MIDSNAEREATPLKEEPNFVYPECVESGMEETSEESIFGLVLLS